MKKKQDKLHLLKGLKRILLDIDRAIQIIRDTEEDAEVVPNLMIGFGIDSTQAEFVAEIKLRNINKEYILKRVEEVDSLEAEIADLQDTLDKPARIRNIMIDELAAVRKSTPCHGAPVFFTAMRWRNSTRKKKRRIIPSPCFYLGKGISKRSRLSLCA